MLIRRVHEAKVAGDGANVGTGVDHTVRDIAASGTGRPAPPDRLTA
jgi:hypothetical protein